MDAQSGGAFDWLNRKFYVHGGGHNDWYGNSVCSLDIGASLTSSPSGINFFVQPTALHAAQTTGPNIGAQAGGAEGLPARGITNVVRTSNVVTLTCDISCPFSVNDHVQVANTALVDSTDVVVTGTPSSTTFTYTLAGSDIGSTGVTARASGYTAPNARHTYQGDVIDPTSGKLVTIGGFLSPNATGTNQAWSLNLSSGVWTWEGTPSGTPPSAANAGSNPVLLGIKNSTRGDRLWLGSNGDLYEWDHTSAPGTMTKRTSGSPMLTNGAWTQCSGGIDPINEYAVFICGDSRAAHSAGYYAVSIASGSSFTVKTLTQTSCDTANGFTANVYTSGLNITSPGLDWDWKHSEMVGYLGNGNDLYKMAINYGANTVTCTTETVASGPSTYNMGISGVFNRWAYSRQDDLWLLCQGGNTNCYVLKRN
jgi:hypothetical protein